MKGKTGRDKAKSMLARCGYKSGGATAAHSTSEKASHYAVGGMPKRNLGKHGRGKPKTQVNIIMGAKPPMAGGDMPGKPMMPPAPIAPASPIPGTPPGIARGGKIKRAAGGKVPHMTAGAGSGAGRLQKLGKKP